MGTPLAFSLDDSSSRRSVRIEYCAQALRDLRYARRYLVSAAYLKIDQKPVIFVFGYEHVEPHIRWSDVRAQLGIEVVLLDKDPDPLDATHDAQYDGHFAWVQPTTPPGWQPDGMEWGEGYLRFSYANSIPRIREALGRLGDFLRERDARPEVRGRRGP